MNLNGLCSKITSLSDFVRLSRLDVVGITESHLLPHVSDSFVQIPNYAFIRNDAKGKVYKHGVCVYVSDAIMITDIDTPLPNVITFCMLPFKVFVSVIYRPPSNSDTENELLCSFLRNFCTNKEVILMGDFNLPRLDWRHGAPNSTTGCSQTEVMFLDAFDSLGLIQWVTQPTYPRSGNTLDLVLTSESDRIGCIEVCAPLPGCDHCPISFDYVFDNSDSMHSSEGSKPLHSHNRRAWNRGHYAQMSRALRDIDWDIELSHRNTEDSFNHFAAIISDMTDRFVPKRQHNSTRVPWRTRPPTSLIHRRQEAWRMYKLKRHSFGRNSAGAKAAFTFFSGINREVRTFAFRSQCDYETNLIDRARDNPKLLHSYIRNKKVCRPTVGPLLTTSGQLTDSPAAMAELFASSFASVFSTEIPLNPFPHQVYSGTLSQVSITPDLINSALTDLDPNSAMGPDGIHPIVLKKCADILVYPLQIVFNRSLREGCLPSGWKQSLVIPIHKKGPRSNPLNYRPISLTSVVCKTMERIVCNQLRHYLESNSLLTSNQFGFRAGRSTMDQLLITYNTVSKNTDLGGVTDVILFDFSKAFDVVCHKLMITKLKSLGLQADIISWIMSFLQGRQMQVSVKGDLSSPRHVRSGVPQGSVLGPLLFLVYIDSVASQLTSDYKIFADDLKLYACVKHSLGTLPVISTDLIQRDIDILQATAASWCLKINASKCAVLRFARHCAKVSSPSPVYFLDGQQIPFVDAHDDLGVLISSDLKFHEHIRTVVRKASGLASSFLKSFVCRSPDFMMFLFTTHVRPVIEYCSCLWNTGYLGDLRALENIQRKWTKQIDGLGAQSYADRLRLLQLYSVQGRLMRADLMQCWKIFNGKSPITPDDLFDRPSQARTRGHCHKIFPPITHTDVRKRFFTVRCITAWNALPADVVCSSNLASFKKTLDRCAHDALYAYV